MHVPGSLSCRSPSAPVRAEPACSRVSGHRAIRRAFLGLASAVLCGASARAAGAGDVARSQYDLSVLFVEVYRDRFRCRLFKRKGFQWEERGDDGKWTAVDVSVVQAAAELGARVYQATGANGEPYPAPDMGGDLEGATAPVTSGAAVPCGECGATFAPAPDGNPRYCDACLPVVTERVLRRGTSPSGEACGGQDGAHVGAFAQEQRSTETGGGASCGLGEADRGPAGLGTGPASVLGRGHDER